MKNLKNTNTQENTESRGHEYINRERGEESEGANEYEEKREHPVENWRTNSTSGEEKRNKSDQTANNMGDNSIEEDSINNNYQPNYKNPQYIPGMANHNIQYSMDQYHTEIHHNNIHPNNSYPNDQYNNTLDEFISTGQIHNLNNNLNPSDNLHPNNAPHSNNPSQFVNDADLNGLPPAYAEFMRNKPDYGAMVNYQTNSMNNSSSMNNNSGNYVPNDRFPPLTSSYEFDPKLNPDEIKLKWRKEKKTELQPRRAERRRQSISENWRRGRSI